MGSKSQRFWQAVCKTALSGNGSTPLLPTLLDDVRLGMLGAIPVDRGSIPRVGTMGARCKVHGSE